STTCCSDSKSGWLGDSIGSLYKTRTLIGGMIGFSDFSLELATDHRPLALGRRLQYGFDQLGITPTAQPGLDDQIAGFWVQTRQRIDFQEIGNTVAQSKIDAGHVTAAERSTDRQCGLSNCLEAGGKDLRRAFIPDLRKEITLDLQAV